MGSKIPDTRSEGPANIELESFDPGESASGTFHAELGVEAGETNIFEGSFAADDCSLPTGMVAASCNGRAL
jgi:hypothetical protein